MGVLTMTWGSAELLATDLRSGAGIFSLGAGLFSVIVAVLGFRAATKLPAAAPAAPDNSTIRSFNSWPVRVTVAIGVPVAVLLLAMAAAWVHRAVKDEPLNYRLTVISLSYAIPAFVFFLGSLIGYWIGRVRESASRPPSA